MKPRNQFVDALLDDLYEFTTAYVYWRNGRHEEPAVFDLFFRRNPFAGAFTIFAGLEEAIRHVESFGFDPTQIAYLREVLPQCDDGFFDWLRELDASQVTIHAMDEGTVVFPRIPLYRVEGPLGICQLLETTLLNVTGFASLIATNAARMRMAAGADKTLLEFGLRRAQGPDGAMTASYGSYIGGFDGTSNARAGLEYGIPVKGTHPHSFVQSHAGFDQLRESTIIDPQGQTTPFTERVLAQRQKLGYTHTNESELAAFVAYAQAFPSGFLALVDTYDTLRSGVPNCICVALALQEVGYEPVGIRLDSGDLAHLSHEARKLFQKAGLNQMKIAASNDINEETLHALDRQGHEIDIFGIGTNLVTCQTQPSLGVVYKLVEIDGVPRIKLSDQIIKVTIPGKKRAYRLIGKDGHPLADLLIEDGELPPSPRTEVLCRHPFSERKRMVVLPTEVVPLHRRIWDGKPKGSRPTIQEIRQRVQDQLAGARPDHLRLINPTPYKVSVSQQLYDAIHKLWLDGAPIAVIE